MRHHAMFSYLFLTFSFVLNALSTSVNPYTLYFYLNISLLLYVLRSIYMLWKGSNKAILLHPLALSFVFNFLFFGGGLTYFFLIDENYKPASAMLSEIYVDPVYLVKAGFLINISAVCTWWGYHSSLARRLSNYFTRLFSNLGSRQIVPNTFILICLFVLGYAVKIILMDLGLYGRLLDAESVAFGSGTSFLASQTAPLKNLSLIPFVFVCYSYFKHGRLSWLFYSSSVLEFFFAFLEAARGPVMALFIIMAAIKYYSTRNIDLKWVSFGMLVVYFAFTIVHDFKYYILYSDITRGTPIELVEGFLNHVSLTDEEEEEESLSNTLYLKIFGRMNYVMEMSAAIAYKDEVGLKKSDPAFLEELLSVPIDVVIPRSVQGTVSVSWGDWFRYYVLHRGSLDTTYSIAFSPLAFFYFIGGTIVVIIGFFGYGIILRSIENLFNLGFMGFLLFVLIGATIIIFKTAIPQILVAYLRLLIFAGIISKILPTVSKKNIL
jgi:hypothetical protein